MGAEQEAGGGSPWRTMARLMANRYVLVLAVYFVWVFFFDANSLLNIYAARRRISNLEKKRAYYEQRIAEDEARLEELRTSRVSLEKFAREQYYMRAPQEDIYVVE